MHCTDDCGRGISNELFEYPTTKMRHTKTTSKYTLNRSDRSIAGLNKLEKQTGIEDTLIS